VFAKTWNKIYLYLHTLNYAHAPIMAKPKTVIPNGNSTASRMN